MAKVCEISYLPLDKGRRLQRPAATTIVREAPCPQPAAGLEVTGKEKEEHPVRARFPRRKALLAKPGKMLFSDSSGVYCSRQCDRAFGRQCLGRKVLSSRKG